MRNPVGSENIVNVIARLPSLRIAACSLVLDLIFVLLFISLYREEKVVNQV